MAEYVWSLAAISWNMVRERLRGPIDVIQIVNPPDWLAIPAEALRSFGAKMVFDVADLSTALYESKFRKRDWAFVLLRCLMTWALRRADLVVASNRSYQRIAAVVGCRAAGSTVTIQSYMEGAAPRATDRAAGPIRIGYFGILGSQDGVDRLLDAIACLAVQEELPPFEALIVGDGPERAALHQRCRQLGLQQRVRFLGFLEGEVRDQTIASFDIAVACDPLNRYTRFISMNKIFAYAAAGVPVVCSPLPGTRRLLGDAAEYADDCSPGALAAALGRLLRDGEARERLRSRIQTVADQRFDWEGESERYAHAVGGLIGALA